MNRLFLEFLVSGSITIIGIALFIMQKRSFDKREDKEIDNFREFRGVLSLIGIGLLCFALSLVDLYHFANK